MNNADLAMLAVLLLCPPGATYGHGHGIGTDWESHFVWLADESQWVYRPQSAQTWLFCGPPIDWPHWDAWLDRQLERERERDRALRYGLLTRTLGE